MSIISFQGTSPVIHPSAFVADTASIIGNVTLEKDVSIWFGAVLRGDMNKIVIGEGSNVQDNCVIHVSRDKNPTTLGKFVTVGHRVIIHGATIHDYVLVGMGAIIMDNCIIEENVLIGAGALVTENMKIPAGSLVLGSPAKVIRPLKPEELQHIRTRAAHQYIELAKKYKTN